MDVSILFTLPSAGRFRYQYRVVNSQDIAVHYFMMLYFTTHQCRWLLSSRCLNGRNLGGRFRGLIKVFSQHLSGWAEDNHENLRITCVTAENPTGHLRITSSQQYRYTNLLKGLGCSCCSFLSLYVICNCYPLFSCKFCTSIVNDQLDAQFLYFMIRLLQSSTCFEQRRAHHQKVKLY